MKKVIVIVGPTAIGKTALSVTLANQFPADIISGDAMQVYCGMDIGTGKVTEAEKKGIIHHMLDIKQPDEPFSVAEFKTLVKNHIKEIHQKNRVPILVGGSGLYIQSVLYDYAFSNQKRDEFITKQLEKKLHHEGNDALYSELLLIDPEHAKTIHPNNYRRVIRALEVYETTKMTMTELHKRQKKTPYYDHHIIGLEMNRETLYDRINQRVDKMVMNGLIDEVRFFYEQGLKDAQAMNAIGYKELIPYFEGKIHLDDAIMTLKRNSRRFAKRQYTWFKNKMDIHWYQMEKNNAKQTTMQIIEDCQTFLKT